MKTTYAQTNMTLGEISPRAFGRFDADKPIFKNAVALMENWLLYQLGGAIFRPGTKYVAELKSSSNAARLEPFSYSTIQQYILEMGALYIRFYANGGQLLNLGVPVEIITTYAQADIFDVHTANKDDVMYMFHRSYPTKKLIRTSATTFSFSDAPFIRGPFIDTNITATTITPSADVGAGITITASTAIFAAGHVGSLWRVKSGVVKITAFTSTTVLVGDVQAEPTGVAGNLGTGPGATADWAEGAYSGVRGYPATGTFHEDRLVLGGTTMDPQTIDGSTLAAYDNFNKGTATQADAYRFKIASNKVNDIRWLASDVALKMGTSGGTVSASGGSAIISPTNPPQIVIDTDYPSMKRQPERISSWVYYLQASTYLMRQLVFDLYLNKDKSEDQTKLADHILRDGSGALQMDKQGSPNDRLWVVRNDGQMAVLTRNAEEGVLGWCRLIAGSDAKGAGLFESVGILTQDGADDQIWVIVKRNINGSVKRYVEYFTPEYFTNYWDPVRLDASLTYNTPITITGITKASPAVVTAVAHGFSNGNQIKIDRVVGMTDVNTNIYYVANKTADTFQLVDSDGNPIDSSAFGTYISGGEVRKMLTAFAGLSHLEGEVVSVQADGGLPADTQTYTVSGGAITLSRPAAVVHVGLPYTANNKIRFLPMGYEAQGGTSQTKMRKLYLATLRVFASQGGQFGKDLTTLQSIPNPNQTPDLAPGHVALPYTGDIELDIQADPDDYVSPYLIQNQPLPFMILASVFRSEVEDR